VVAQTRREYRKEPPASGRIAGGSRRPCLAPAPGEDEEAALRADDLPADVLDAAQRGEPAAVEAVYRRYAPAVLAWFRARLGDTHLAEDLTGDAFVAVLGALPRYAGGPEQFAGWLFTLVRRDFVDHLRRSERRPETPVAEPAESGVVPDTADEVLARADSARVRAALGQLSPDQQEVLVLRVVAGLTAPEVAAATGRTVGAVKALQHRGLDSLGRLLGRAPDPYPRKASRRL
jgi:RNA polymerase sigma-70 factor (ECF subfamily)